MTRLGFALASAFACTSMALACGGCTSGASQKKVIAIGGPSAADINAATREVQQATLVFADRFMAAVAESSDDLERNATTPQARIAAQGRKIGCALATMKNAVQPNPYAGLLDTVVMVTLLRDSMGNPSLDTLYGAAAAVRTRSVYQLQEKDAWNVASRFFTEAQLQELRQSIDRWLETHPNSNYVSFVRLDEFPETKQIAGGDARSRPNSVFGLLFLDPFSGIDPAVKQVELSRQLAERMFYYFQRMPMVMAWQADQLYNQMLAAPEVQTTVGQTQRFVGSTTRFADATDAFAQTCEKFRLDLAAYRTQTMRDLDQIVDRQRDAAIRQATTQISVQRDAALEQVVQLTATLRIEQEKVVEKLRMATDASIDHLHDKLQATSDRSIDHLYAKLWRLAVIVIGGVFAAAVAFRLLFGARGSRRVGEKHHDRAALGAVVRS